MIIGRLDIGRIFDRLSSMRRLGSFDVSTCRRRFRRMAGAVFSTRTASRVVARMLARGGVFGAIAARCQPTKSALRRHSARCLGSLYAELLEPLGIALHLEIGAKDAAASQRAAALPSTVAAIAFEANPSTFRRFSPRLAALGLGSLRYENIALGEHDGTAVLHVGRSRRGKVAANGNASLVIYRKSDAQQIAVPMRSLDSYLDDHGLAEHGLPDSRTNALWIDVEGAYASVLRGAARTLAATALIHIEVEDVELFDGQEWLHHDVERHLATFGLVPLARDAQAPHQFNVVYVHSSRLDDPAVHSALQRWRQDVRQVPR